MIKVLQTDTIIDVVNKINNCEEKEILIEFPFWHNILHNYMSLKILKNKAWNKKITILTNDIVSRKIWTPLWINYSVIKDSDFHKEKNFKQELLKHNFTFSQYFIFEMKKYWVRFINFLWKKTWINTLKYYNPYDRVKKTWLMFLFLWLFTSIWMLFFIFYFAVSKTFIEITPEINIKTKATNIIYEEWTSELNIIWKELKVPIKKVDKKIELTFSYKTTWIDYENTSRSTWKAILINELRDEQTFKPKTRLLTTDGLIFETTDWVKIPPRTVNWSWEVLFWQAEVDIIARVYDTNGNFIWTRWNIKDAIFTIPWLKFNQDKIYAKLAWETTWWKDDIKYVVWEQDLKNALKIFEEILKTESLKQLKQKIEEDNKIAWVKYEILPIKDVLKYKDLEIKTIPKEINIWDKIDKFELKWSITIETYIYNKNLVLSLLKNVINDSLLNWTDKLIFIDENSLRMTVILSKTENPLTIKATTEVDIWISYDFDNNANFYNQRLKTLILWLSNDEAKNILINEEKISDVSIKNTPFFIKNVSSNIDNIIMKITQK